MWQDFKAFISRGNVLDLAIAVIIGAAFSSVVKTFTDGIVNGDIIATEKIQLGRTARVMGNISTPKLVVEEGAVFEGGCTMLKARENQERAATEAQAQYHAAESTSYSIGASDDDDADDFAASAETEEAEAAVS
jgi:hypothetical protein